MELPRVRLNGAWYFRDDRLREFRRCDNPHERITFEQTAMTPTAFRGHDGHRCSLRACNVEE